MKRAFATQKPRFRNFSLSKLRSESGFALVEVMVSAVLLVVLSLASYPIIDQSANRSSSNRARGVAVGLAEQDQDRMRAMPLATLETLDETRTKTSNGVTFTIKSKAQYASDSSGIIACASNTGGQQYLQVATTITWPKMNGVAPVTVESIVTPNVAQGDHGSVTVIISKANGTGQPNIAVTVGGQSKMTDSSGCAQWTKLPKGSTTLSFGASGYLTPTLQTAVSETFNVKAGESANKSYAYDLGSSFPTSIKRLSGGAATRWPTVRYLGGTADFTRTTVSPFNAVSATEVGQQYPWFSGYKVYAGTCNGNDPSSYFSTFYGSNPTGQAVPPTPGSNTNLNAFTRKATIRVTKTTNTAGTGGYLSALPYIRITPAASMAGPGCESIARAQMATSVAASTETKTVDSSSLTGVSTSQATFSIDLPWGLYSICVDNGTVKRSITQYNNTPTGSNLPTPATAPAPTTGTPTINLIAGTVAGQTTTATGTC